MTPSAVEIRNLTHCYGERTALSEVDLSIERGEIFGIIGPNGGGKSTLFKILSTLVIPTAGSASVLGHDVVKDAAQVRRSLGIIFQSPALDKKLSVFENLEHQGHLYGMRGTALKQAIEGSLSAFGILDRAKDRIEKLSGGLKRRVEIARALLHGPQMLLMDEPTTGLDPLARREVWELISTLRAKKGLTVLLTTHLLEEAEGCTHIAFLNKGKLVVKGEPQELRASLGNDILKIRSAQAATLKPRLEALTGESVTLVENELRIQKEKGHELIPQILLQCGSEISSVTLGKPTLEDLFIELTGHRFMQAGVV